MAECNHFYVTHSHASGYYCVSCGKDKPEPKGA